MANEKNLLKGNEKHTFTPEELSKGGKASAEARRKKRDLRQALEILLETDVKNKKGEVKSGAEAIAIAQFQKALKGDTRAFEVIRDTAGQKPIEKVAIGDVTADVINEVENMVLGDKE
jgi:hypothetical protein